MQVTALSGIVAITAGNWHSVALSSDGTVWAWGYNIDGQLGMGGVSQYYGGTDPNNTPTPRHVVDGLGGSLSGVIEISSLQYHTLAVRSDGTVWAWGRGDWGQLGNGGTSASGTPVQAEGLSGMVGVAAGYLHSVALKSDGTVWTWGYNGYGQLGNGTRDGDSHPTATQVPGLSGVVAISAGVFSSLALQSQAGAMAWGGNVQGALGNGNNVNSSTPVAVAALSGLSAITGGWVHSVALRSDGTVWAWGYNASGELGDGSNATRNTPGQVLRLAGMVAIASGDHHNVALRSDGTVWAWGANESGELGDGSTANRTEPVQVRGPGGSGFLSNIVSVACGAFHSIALRSDGTVWAWGANNVGQLGNPSAAYTNQSSPVPVMSGGTALSHLVAIAGGYTFSLALRSDGTVWAWGANSNGEWGTGAIGGWSYVPVHSSISGVVSISAGAGFHSLALLSDGTVRAWGYNLYGQLGNDGTLDSGTPVQALGFSGGAAVSAGYEHSVALRSDGTVWAWGYNGEGQVGDGTTVDRTAPVSVSTLPAVGTIGAGGLDSFALVDVGQSAPASWLLIITADNEVITYGGAAPTLRYSLSPSVTPDTPPTCATTATAASPVGTYPITCSGAAKAGYEVTYVSGTLTVNPAPLTIIADNKSMGLGSTVPLLTASYFGLVNGDTPAVVGGSVELTTNATASSPVGTYDITFANAPALPDYTVTTVLGTLTVNPDLLTFNNNYFVTGDFAVGWVSLRGQGDGTGFATGEISIPNVGLSDPANTVPVGADIVAAYLYWQAVEWSGFAPEANGFFRDYTITGEQLGSDLPFTPVPAPALVGGGVSTVMRMYRANVLPYLPLGADGRRLPAGPHTVRLPEGGAAGLPFNSGVSLVVIYRVLSKDFPLKAIVLYDGAWVREDGLRLTVRGFYDANLGQAARVFNMASTASGLVPNLLNFPPPEGTAGQYSETFPAHEGTAGGMQIFSVAVNDSDGDGLLDAWESAGGYYEVSDGSWVPLPGAVNGQRDMFAQLDYMCSAVNSDGTCDPANSRLPQPDPATGEDPLLMVQQAFDASGIKLHYLIGHAIQEETCHDDLAANPPRRCQFPEEPGVVGWKSGLEVFKVWARDPAGCVAGNADSCRPRFERGQKDSYHYVLFGRSLAVAAWNTRARTLDSIVVSNGAATITTPARAPLNGRDLSHARDDFGRTRGSGVERGLRRARAAGAIPSSRSRPPESATGRTTSPHRRPTSVSRCWPSSPATFPAFPATPTWAAPTPR